VFRSKANKLEKLLKKSVPGVCIERNTERPRKGTFEVVANGETMVSLEAMPRPFKKLRELDIDGLSESIVGKLGKGKPKKSSKAEGKDEETTEEPESKPAPKKGVEKAPAKKAAAKKAPPKKAAPTKRKGTRSSARVRAKKAKA